MNKLPIIAGAAVLVVIGVGAYLYLQAPQSPPEAPVTPAVAPVTPSESPPVPAAAAEPRILHPLAAASEPAAADSGAAMASLPPLAEADGFVVELLNDLLGRPAVLRMLQTDAFVHRIVATVDNLPNRHAASRLWPVQPTGGRFATLQRDGRLLVDPDNAGRYVPLVQFVQAVDPARAAALYKRLYPLFQQAYRDLGYPQGYFNDRLVQVIDHLQATPQVEGPIELTLTEVKGPYPSTAPWLRYEFADPALQSLSAGQRMLLRSGVVNQRRLLAWLAALRVQITR